MTDRPVLEAVGEVLADIDGFHSSFQFGVWLIAGRTDESDPIVSKYTARAGVLISRLAALGWTLSPTPIVNAGEERAAEGA